jgi:hypothetical protein
MVYLKKSGDYNSICTEMDYKEGAVVYVLSDVLVSKKKTRTSICVGSDKNVEDKVGMYINHSCTPSCEIDGFNVVALRDIMAGEEVTFDYSSEGELAAPFFCNCCGKYIDGKAA